MCGLRVRPVLVVALLMTVGALWPARADAVVAPLAPLVLNAGLREAGQPRLLVTPMTVAPGSTLTVAGTGYAAGEPVQATLAGIALATTPAVVMTDAQGNFIAAATVPDTVVSGPDLLVVGGARSGLSAHAMIEVRRPAAATWYFAGLDTRGSTRSTIAVLNPDNNPARVTLHLARTDGPAAERAVTLPSHSRSTLDLAALSGGEHALLFVRLTADRRVFAAATITRGTNAGSDIAGVSTPRRTWYLAEGYVDKAAHEYLRLYNPSPRPVHATVRLLPQQGPSRLVQLVLGGDRGRELAVDAYVQRQAVGAVAQASTPLVVQRFSTFGPHAAGATVSTGVAHTATTWTFPVGIAPAGSLTFYAVANPDPINPAAVTATFYDARRHTLSRATAVMAPRHRATIVAPANSRGAAMVVLSGNIPMVAERTILIIPPHAPGPAWASAGYTVGPASPTSGQVFPLGNTGAGYQEYLVAQNTSGQSAQVGIEFYTTRGSAVHHDLTLPAHTRAVVAVNGVRGLPPGAHGAVVFATGAAVFLEQRIASAGGAGLSARRTPTRAALPRRATRPARARCTILLPRVAFPTHMTTWVSTMTTPNAGANASGLQLVHYRWGYVVVTSNLYGSVAGAQQHYQQAAQLLHGGRQVPAPAIGQQLVAWVTGDELTHYTITTILLRARATVTEINVGAGGPVVGVAADIARAVNTWACG